MLYWTSLGVLATAHLAKTAPSLLELVALLFKLLHWQLYHIANVLAATVLPLSTLASRVIIAFLI